MIPSPASTSALSVEGLRARMTRRIMVKRKTERQTREDSYSEASMEEPMTDEFDGYSDGVYDECSR